MHLKPIAFPFIFLTFLLLNACQSDPATNISENPKPKVDSSTVKMAQLINEATARVNPENVSYYLNRDRSIIFAQKAATTEDQVRMQHLVQSTTELLNAGDTETAILQFQNLFTELNKNDIQIPDQLQLGIFRVIGSAYMKLGQQKNLQANNTTASSLFPISSKGTYTIKQGPQTAIPIYERILQASPKDLPTRYLLNLAYMLIGEYPGKVPAKWLIPAKAFASDKEVAQFKEIAKKSNTAIKGLTGGCVVEDFNNDGLLDIMASSWGFSDGLQLLFNQGDGNFENVSKASGISGLNSGANLVQADYNNDGFVDVFVLRGAWLGVEGKIPNSLLKNNGDGTFTDVSQEANVFSSMPSQSAAWADFNLDGWIDLVVGNETTQQENEFPCELYINNTDGTFTNRALKAGIKAISGFVKGVAVGDLNNDGFPDIYFSRMNMPNKLMMNAGANAPEQIRFVDISTYAVVEEPQVSFPTWFFDYDNDGWEDIFVSGYALPSQTASPLAQVTTNFLGNPAPASPRLYKNNADNTFTEVSAAQGLSDALISMGGNYGDINNDGFPDAYLGTGGLGLDATIPNRLLVNEAGKNFAEVSAAAGVGHIQKGNGIGFGDFDNDGDQDIYAVMGGAYEGDVSPNVLFENPGVPENSWITIRLEGKTSNRKAIGARIKVTVALADGGEAVYYSTVSSGGSQGASSLQQELGLGKATRIKELEIKWPYVAQEVSVYTDLEVRQVIRVVEGVEEVEVVEGRGFEF